MKYEPKTAEKIDDSFSTTIIALAAIMGLASTSAFAFAPRRLKPDELSQCRELAKTGLAEWRKPDLSQLPPASNDGQKYTHELPLVLSVINHKTYWETTIDEDEIAYHLETTREAFHQCGIEVTVESLRYLDAPKFLDSLDHHPDSRDLRSDQQRCLMDAAQKPGFVNVYFVHNVRSNHQFGGPSHAIRDGVERSAAIIVDSNRSGTTVDGKTNFKREILMPHEVGHVVFDSSRPVEGLPSNLMNHDAPNSLKVTPEQCERARRSPFVRAKRSLF